VLCAGQIEHKDLEQQAANADLAKKVYTIGGAYKAGELDAKRAIDMGFRLAMQIHNPEVVPGKHVFQSRPSSEEKLMKLLRRYM
jgi:2,4-dienoyl-CoA reductase (NADPH2)